MGGDADEAAVGGGRAGGIAPRPGGDGAGGGAGETAVVIDDELRLGNLPRGLADGGDHHQRVERRQRQPGDGAAGRQPRGDVGGERRHQRQTDEILRVEVAVRERRPIADQDLRQLVAAGDEHRRGDRQQRQPAGMEQPVAVQAEPPRKPQRDPGEEKRAVGVEPAVDRPCERVEHAPRKPQFHGAVEGGKRQAAVAARRRRAAAAGHRPQHEHPEAPGVGIADEPADGRAKGIAAPRRSEGADDRRGCHGHQDDAHRIGGDASQQAGVEQRRPPRGARCDRREAHPQQQEGDRQCGESDVGRAPEDLEPRPRRIMDPQRHQHAQRPHRRQRALREAPRQEQHRQGDDDREQRVRGERLPTGDVERIPSTEQVAQPDPRPQHGDVAEHGVVGAGVEDSVPKAVREQQRRPLAVLGEEHRRHPRAGRAGEEHHERRRGGGAERERAAVDDVPDVLDDKVHDARRGRRVGRGRRRIAHRRASEGWAAWRRRTWSVVPSGRATGSPSADRPEVNATGRASGVV